MATDSPTIYSRMANKLEAQIAAQKAEVAEERTRLMHQTLHHPYLSGREKEQMIQAIRNDDIAAYAYVAVGNLERRLEEAQKEIAELKKKLDAKEGHK